MLDVGTKIIVMEIILHAFSLDRAEPQKMCRHGHHKKIGLAHADLLYYKTKNILFLSCTPMVLIYNSEVGVIICSEFFSCKETPEEALCTP